MKYYCKFYVGEKKKSIGYIIINTGYTIDDNIIHACSTYNRQSYSLTECRVLIKSFNNYHNKVLKDNYKSKIVSII